MENSEALRGALIKPNAFLITEFDALRREIELEIKEIGDFLRYAILSSGAIWAWLLSRPDSRIPHIGCFVPLVLTLLLFGHTVVIRTKIFGIAKYIKRIEQLSDLPNELGWETQFEKGFKRGNVENWEYTTWAILGAANAAGAILVMVFL
jgi:hypothetical protein